MKIQCKQQLCLVVIIMWVVCGSSWAQHSSPCPKTFQYHYNHQMSEWFGVVQVPSPMLGSTLHLNIYLIVTTRLPTSYVGRLELYNTREETINRIKQQQPVLYKIKFPLQYPLPKLQSILYNNKVICQGDTSGNNYNFAERVTYITKIGLEHTLYTTATGSQLPAFYPGLLPTTTLPPPAPPVYIPPAPPVYVPPPTDPVLPAIPVPDLQPDFKTLTPTQPHCGQLDNAYTVTPLIFGGDQIERGQWPWLTALYTYMDNALSFRCGGSLISTKLVLTAAHCVRGRDMQTIRIDDFQVYLGQHNLKRLHDPGSVPSSLSAIHVHPDFLKDPKGSYDADIAILVMEQTITYSRFIQPVCLWGGDVDESKVFGKTGVVVGWGKDESNKLFTKTPKRAYVPIVSHIDCIRSAETFFRITSPRTLCGGGKNDVGPCNGDSGGGLIMYEDSRWQLRGIISLALADPNTGACNLKQYVVFTDVAKFLDWIQPFMSMS